MLSYLKKSALVLSGVGLNFIQFFNSAKGIPAFINDYRKLKKQLRQDTSFKIKSFYPCLSDRYMESGYTNDQYFTQDLYVAQLIFKNKPQKHIDIGSRVAGFVSHVAAFMEIEIVDIRPLSINLPNIKFIQANLMEEASNLNEYCHSISCLHALEHFGLGRYGDTIDHEGHIKGFHNITKILKPGGTFYFSTPIGPQRIDFNAQRVFCLQYLIDLIIKSYEIVSFSYIDDKNVLHSSIQLDKAMIDSNCGCNYGCGIWVLKKK